MKKIIQLLALIVLTSIRIFAQQSTNYTGAVINEVKVIGPSEKNVTINTNVPAERIINGTKHGIADTATYKFRFGEYRIELRAEGYLTIIQTLRISSKSPQSYIFNLQPDPSFVKQTITIKSNVETNRVIDRQDAGKAVSSQYELRRGNHSVKLSAKGYLTKSRTINVNPKSPKVFSYNLLPIPNQWEQFVLFNYAGSHIPQHSIGITYGQVKRWGWYVNFMLGIGFHYKTDYVADSRGCIDGYMPLYSGKASHNRVSLTGGGVFRIIPWLGLYAGMGYGYRSLTWEMQNGAWVQINSDGSPLHGVSMEGGLLGSIKGFSLSIGISSIFSGNGGFPEAKLGVGYMFK